jgi:tetratricopeptide (TPR) repeat protein
MQTQELIKRLDAAFDKRRAGDPSTALDEFEHLEKLSTHPQDIAAIRLFQVMCLTDLGRIEEADQRIRLVNEKKLDDVDRIDYESEYARIKRVEGLTTEALERVERALHLSETVEDKRRVEIASKSLQALRGVLLAESGNCNEAIPILEEVPPDVPWWADARLLLGDCSYRSRRYREAIDYYLSLISSANHVESVIRNDAFRNIGCAYHQLGDYAKAAEYLSNIKDAYDQYPEIKAKLFGFLASAYSHLGMTQEAAKYSGFSRGSSSVQ